MGIQKRVKRKLSLRNNSRYPQALKVDCHTHILPDMDDGAKDTQTACEMLCASAAYGVETVLLTPHYYACVESPKAFLKRRDASLQLLQETVVDFEMPRFVIGAEVRLERDISALPALKELCLSGSSHMLLEMPYLPLDSWMIEEIENICYGLGCNVILAHLPRYSAYYNDNDFEELLSLPDVLIQINAEDLLFKHSKKRVLQWIDRGLPLLFGSDCHNMDSRCPNLDQVAKYMYKPRRGIIPADEANALAADIGWL